MAVSQPTEPRGDLRYSLRYRSSYTMGVGGTNSPREDERMKDIHIGLISGRHDSMRTSEGGEMDGYVWEGRIANNKLSNPHLLDIDAIIWLGENWESLDLGNEAKTFRLYLTGLNHAQVAFSNAWQRMCEQKGRTPRGLVVMHYNPKTHGYEEQTIYFPQPDRSYSEMVKPIPLMNDAERKEAQEAAWMLTTFGDDPKDRIKAMTMLWFRMTGTWTFAEGEEIMREEIDSMHDWS